MILGIYGSGGLGREVLELAKQINTTENRWTEFVFINDVNKTFELKGNKVFTFVEIKEKYNPKNIEIVIAVGEPQLRRIFRETVCLAGFKLATLIHPTAQIYSDTVMGAGTVVNCNCWISCDIVIGENVYIQPSVLIGHDTTVGNDTVISPCIIAGGCNIGNEIYIGLSATIKEKIKVGNQAIIGMGSVVLRDVPAELVVLGNPAKVIAKNEEHRVFK